MDGKAPADGASLSVRVGLYGSFTTGIAFTVGWRDCSAAHGHLEAHFFVLRMQHVEPGGWTGAVVLPPPPQQDDPRGRGARAVGAEVRWVGVSSDRAVSLC